MRVIPGINQTISNESISSYHLVRQMLNKPDIMPTVMEMFKEEQTPLSSLLSMKGLKSRGLFEGMYNSMYKTVSSNHIMYRIKSSSMRKMRLVTNTDGVTFVADAYSTQPGRDRTAFYIWLDSNWAGPKEILEMSDNRTKLYISDDDLPVYVKGGWRYMVKVVATSNSEFCDLGLLVEGEECAPVMTAYEHDWSTTGVEKYTFDGWGHVYLSLQRLKYSSSGTAQAMKTEQVWTEHFSKGKGKMVNSFVTKQEYEMLKRAAKYHEYALIFGKGTVDQDGKVFLTDKKNREIMVGDGIMYQGEGAYDYPYQEWTEKFLETLMADVDLRSGADGKVECVLSGGKQVTMGFAKLMRKMGVTANENIEGSGDNKGINNSYTSYTFDGVKVNINRWRWLDSPERPSKELPDGTRKGSWDGFIIPLGDTAEGDKGIELIQLRAPSMGTVNGINSAKDGTMASSVDGDHTHILWQSGVISRNKITTIYRPSYDRKYF